MPCCPEEQVLREVTDYIDQCQSCNKKVSTTTQIQDDLLLPTASIPSAPTFTHQLYVDAAQDSQLIKMGFAYLSYIPRGANETAHCLARTALGLDQEALWKNSSL
uniref:RNase H type-1 domain-containing protein n=1 Tax=Cannabis sativa TaxID=3483 RepID=A0A803QFR1_CANSA